MLFLGKTVVFIRRHVAYAIIVAVIVLSGLVTTVFYSLPPSNFPSSLKVMIAKNTSLGQIADQLVRDDIIRSAFIFKVYTYILGGSRKVMAGTYVFDKPQSALRVAYRTITGNQGLPRVKIVVPEGIASYDIARILDKNIPGFDAKSFLQLAKPNEGYLFPDTYYFYDNVEPADVVNTMVDNFDRKTASIDFLMTISKRSKADIIKMASIVEREAVNAKDRRLVAGILWKRIDAGMPLQVDPPFFYFLGKSSLELTLDDLKTESPYNLYLNKGLPPTAIGNPGLDAISDTLHPTDSPYWFYLSDKDGTMHYAINHEGHLANKDKYLQ